MPKTYATQAILVNHAASAVTSLDPEPVKVGDVAGQPTRRRGLVQGAVRPRVAAEVFVLPQHGHKVALVPYQGSVEQFAAAASDPPFHDAERGPNGRHLLEIITRPYGSGS